MATLLLALHYRMGGGRVVEGTLSPRPDHRVPCTLLLVVRSTFRLGRITRAAHPGARFISAALVRPHRQNVQIPAVIHPPTVADHNYPPASSRRGVLSS